MEPVLNQIINNPMELALQLAELGRYTVSPNPMVGAVLVQGNKLVGYGYHLYKGGSHAESQAIDMAGSNSKGAKLYLNLEPCCHYGATPPCVDKVIASGVSEVHFSALDPNPIINGKSILKMEQAGIKVFVGEMKEEAERLNEIFYHYMTKKTPFIIAKWAMTMDGKIATKHDSQWITGEAARNHVHALRNSVDAIVIGANTLRKDNPSLDVRLDDLAKIRQPIKFVIGSDLDSLPKDLKIFAGNQTYLVKNIKDLLDKMAELSLTSLLVEGGGHTLAKFLQAGLLNKFYCYIAPKFIAGTESISPFNQDIGINFMKDAIEGKFSKTQFLGNDILIEGRFK